MYHDPSQNPQCLTPIRKYEPFDDYNYNENNNKYSDYANQIQS